MMKNYTLFFKSFICCIAILATTTASAQWEQIQVLPATQNIFVAPNGNLISSDFQFDYTGGIHYSVDKGATWTKADVEDFAYTRMIQAGEYIIASGEACHLARSKDNGVTWEVLSYAYMFTDYIPEDAITYNVAYAITYYKNKLFVADFGGGGVIYSEDFGETWTMTDRESLKFVIDGNTTIDCFYNLAENNNELLLFSVYFIYRLNETDYTWELLRSDSNFMGVSTTIDNKLICGRAIMNYNAKSPFLEYTEDGGRTWGSIAHADTTTYDCNVRAIHSDEKGMYVGLQNGGIFYTTDLGLTWLNISQGIPGINNENGTFTYNSPLVITSDEEYLYAAIYDVPWASNTASGIYRYKKENLPTASVDKIINDNVRIFAYNNTLYATQNANITIYDINGNKVKVAQNCNTVDITSLARGLYIYEAYINGNRITGKFAK